MCFSECVPSVKGPLMFGDRFYAFVCSLCNEGVEFMLRLHLRWVDFVHLSTFHLSLLLGKALVHAEDDVMSFLDENVPILQLPKDVRTIT